MDTLVQPWRDTYRTYDTKPFDGNLAQVPNLPNLGADLNHSVLTTNRQVLVLDPIQFGLDTLNSRLCKSTGASKRSQLPELLTIPALDSFSNTEDSQAWCSDFHWRPQRIATRDQNTTTTEVESSSIAPNDRSPRTSIQSCLIALLSGYESAVFTWHLSSNSFQVSKNDVDLGGLPYSACKRIMDACVDWATSFKRLHIAQEFLLSHATQFSPALVQVAVFLRDYLQLCTDHVNSLLRPGTSESILYIWQQSQQNGQALDWLNSLLMLGGGLTIEECVSNWSATTILDKLEQQTRLQTSIYTTKDQVVRELFSCLANTLTKEIASRTGLGPPMLADQSSFLRQSAAQKYDPKSRPTILSDDDVSMIMEIEQGIEFLQRHSRGAQVRNLCRKRTPPHMEFTLIENNLKELEIAVRNWGDSMASGTFEEESVKRSSILSVSRRDGLNALRYPASRQAILQSFHDSINSIEGPHLVEPSDADLGARLQTHCSESGCFDIDQAVRVCLFYPLNLQASYIHAEVLDVLTNNLKLREHLSLLRQIFFFHNGDFTSRLTHALFASEDSSISLNIVSGKRTSYWPPEAATVSFATRHILTETVRPRYFAERNSQLAEQELLGHLGVAMSPEEETQEIPRESLDAMSFLHFNYRTPAPLDMVITPRSLHVYSKINQFLLLLLRMTNTVDRLTSESRQYRIMRRDSSTSERFRIEATHFVRSFTAHVFETVIATHYDAFEATMARKDISIKRLRDAHDGMLDHIANCCFVTSKMTEMQTILRLVFDSILQFSFLPSQERQEDGGKGRGLYSIFDVNARKFIAILGGAEATKSESFATGISARFLMNDFWAMA